MNTPTLYLALDEVEVPTDRLRASDPEKVTEIAISMRERGQLHDIEVLPKNDAGRYPLNIGLHRLLAARAAELPTIAAKVFEGSPLEARLREIDENLYRAELNALDQAVFLAERRAIFEQMHGKVRRGGDQRSKPANLRQRSFFDDTTQAFGLSRDTIERALTRFTRLAPEVRRGLRGTKTARVASEVDALAKLDPAEQIRVVKLLNGEDSPANVAAALVIARGGRASAGRVTKSPLERLQAAWEKTAPDGRKVFVEWLRAEGFMRGARRAAR